jgi:hypothetical protein
MGVSLVDYPYRIRAIDREYDMVVMGILPSWDDGRWVTEPDMFVLDVGLEGILSEYT